MISSCKVLFKTLILICTRLFKSPDIDWPIAAKPRMNQLLCTYALLRAKKDHYFYLTAHILCTKASHGLFCWWSDRIFNSYKSGTYCAQKIIQFYLDLAEFIPTMEWLRFYPMINWTIIIKTLSIIFGQFFDHFKTYFSNKKIDM